MAKPDPKHSQACDAFARLDVGEAKRRIANSDYKSAEYVASEVLASIIRSRFGEHSGVLYVAGSTLYGRLLRLVSVLLRKNPQWHGVARPSRETVSEIGSYIWERLLCDTAETSFAEVRFLTFVEARTQDFIRNQLAKKNKMMRSLDAMRARDQDGRKRPYAELIEDEAMATPEATALAAETSAELNRALLALEPHERRAVYLRIHRELDWNQTARALGCSIPTAKKHLERGLEKLRGEQV